MGIEGDCVLGKLFEKILLMLGTDVHEERE